MSYEAVCAELRRTPQRWVVTGVAGFVGSHLAEALLRLGQQVVGLDDFSTGRRSHVELLSRVPGGELRFVEGDTRDPRVCAEVMEGADRVLHQAALRSVPRSFDDPRATWSVNVEGFANVAFAAAAARVKGFVYASSSSVYGDSPALPRREGSEGRVLSPYAATKRVNELAAEGLSAGCDLPAVGLRYFNVVGPRQDPDGAYATVVPRWIAALARGEPPVLYGDGLTSRDFCPVEEVVRANVLAAVAERPAWGRAVNVGLGGRTTLLELFRLLRDGMAARGAPCAGLEPRFESFRPGDVRHTEADVSLAGSLLGWAPRASLRECLDRVMDEAVSAQ